MGAMLPGMNAVPGAAPPFPLPDPVATPVVIALTTTSAARQSGALPEALDDPLEWDTFGHPVSGQPAIWDSHLLVHGMHCATCALTIEQALRSVPGVLAVEVSAAAGRARLRWAWTRRCCLRPGCGPCGRPATRAFPRWTLRAASGARWTTVLPSGVCSSPPCA